MKTTVELLNEVKTRYQLPSDGRLAAMLGHTRSSISLLMQGKNYLGDEAAMRVADLLDLDPAYVMACIHAEREKNQEVKRVWQRMAERMAVAAVVLVAVVLVSPALGNFGSENGLLLTSSSPTLYIMSNKLAQNWPVFLALFALMLASFPVKLSPPRPRTNQ